MTRMCETQNATIALQAQQLKQQSELLNARKMHKKGKRVRLEGVLVYSMNDVLEIAREEEQKKKKLTTKKKRGRPRKRRIEEIEEDDEDEDIKSLFSNSDIELEECVGRRTRSREEE